MASYETLKHFDRLDVNFRRSIVDEVLPEYYREDYPNLISFLDGYYEYLDSDQSFQGIIDELGTVRDTEDADLKRLDELFHTLALGVSQGQFKFPREAVKNFGNFFRVKGSLYSGEGFFRAFFDTQVEILYPKDKLFNVGSSNIGPEYDQRLQDGKKFQVFSILIKSPLSFAYWEELWRRFVHPTGFYLSGEVVLEGVDTIKMTTDESLPDPFKNIFFIADSAEATGPFVTPQAQGEVSHLNNYVTRKSNFNSKYHINQPQYRTNPYRLIGHWSDSNMSAPVGSKVYPTINDLIGIYKDLEEWADWGIRLDNAIDSNSTAITFDNKYETYDHRRYQTYAPDNAQYVEPNYVDVGYLVDDKTY